VIGDGDFDDSLASIPELESGVTDITVLVRTASRISRDLSARIEAASDLGHYAAEAEEAYRLARKAAWAHAPEGQAALRADFVDGHTAPFRKVRDAAAEDVKANRDAIRSRQIQISLLQSVLAAIRAEIDLARTGPQEQP
jgi:hypothetical protein